MRPLSSRNRKLVLTLAAVVLLPLVGKPENCLWKATSSEGIFYLQGSVHLLKASDYPLAKPIAKAYEQSDALVFETDISQMLSVETQQLLMKKAMLPAGRTLKNELSPEVYAMLAKELEQAGLPAVAVQKFKPWFATTSLTVLRMQAMGLDPEHGLDQYFHKKAVADGKPTHALEPVSFQINLFDSLSQGDQDGFTRHALKELEQLETMLDVMLEAWKSGDLEKLDELVRDSFKGYPEMYESFVAERNRAWAEKLNAMADQDITYMVIVGTAHLGGEEGLLELFKAKGYTIEQL